MNKLSYQNSRPLATFHVCGKPQRSSPGRWVDVHFYGPRACGDAGRLPRTRMLVVSLWLQECVRFHAVVLGWGFEIDYHPHRYRGDYKLGTQLSFYGWWPCPRNRLLRSYLPAWVWRIVRS